MSDTSFQKSRLFSTMVVREAVTLKVPEGD